MVVTISDSFTRKTKKSLRCLLVEVPWQINEYLRPIYSLIPLHNDNNPLPFFSLIWYYIAIKKLTTN